MKTKALLFALWLPVVGLFAQQSRVKWTATIEPQNVFIENKGQFNNNVTKEEIAAHQANDKVLFATEHGAVQILFSKGGVTYLLQKRDYREKGKSGKYEPAKPYKEWEQEEYSPAIQTDAISMEWQNASPTVQLEGIEQVQHYYNYTAGKREISKARAFKKIVYRNLYPGIDVEYVFHPQGGIEYNYILHAGADASNIKMKYAGIEKLELDGKKNLLLPTLFGNAVDHAPVSYYAANTSLKIASQFVVNGNTVGITLGSYDKTKDVIIDPWTVTPTLPNSNKVFCVKTDSSNNVYVYGGDSPFKLQKYNAAGVLQWTYSTPWDSANAWFGTLIVDKAGNAYITRGSLAAIAKVSTQGSLLWLKDVASALFEANEYWGLAFNADETQLLAGGTKQHGNPQYVGAVFTIDPNTGNADSSVQVANTIPVLNLLSAPNEVRSICYSPNGSYYFATLDTIGCITPSLGITYRISRGRPFGYRSPDFGFTPQGQNIICANAFHIYLSTGDSIQKRDILTGNLVTTVAIHGGGVNDMAAMGIFPKNGGIALDNCGNVYVGSQTGVYKYDANLNVLDSASTQDAVYALAVNNNGEVVASGAGFVASINMSACSPYLAPPFSLTVNNTGATCAGVCNGTATAVTSSGTPPFSYVWSNGATTATVNGLCPGVYSLTVTDAAGASMIASTNVLLSPFALTDSILHTPCGSNTGAVGITAITGIAPYSFVWTTGATTSSIFGLTPGSYSVTVTDAVGCVLTKTFSVFGTGNSPVTITSNKILVCANDSALMCAPAGYSGYLWNNGATTSCIYVKDDNPYKVTVTDNSYCTASSNSLAVFVLPLPIVTTSLNGNVFTSSSTSQIMSYRWYRNDTLIGGATTSSYTAQQTGYYKVAVSDNNGCVGYSTPIYYAPCSAYFVLFPDLNTPHNWFAVNQATGAQPISYLWSWGDGTTSNGAFPTHIYATAGYYNICLSIADSNGCTATFCDSSVYMYKTEDIVTVNVVSELPNSINEIDNKGELLLFPNPAGNVLNIRYRGLQAETVRLYNAAGQLIKNISQPTENKVDVSGLSAGVYIAEIVIEGGLVRLKWSKL